ncbi:unnamed protein product [Euphydryas editha]|uniref:Secreted protein n=1 Tax=Euphydryas editha TaxID=104508 RepID=A0AAU9TZ37_EUPED|nr:unnamed protein product [Euphydryas editha]
MPGFLVEIKFCFHFARYLASSIVSPLVSFLLHDVQPSRPWAPVRPCSSDRHIKALSYDTVVFKPVCDMALYFKRSSWSLSTTSQTPRLPRMNVFRTKSGLSHTYTPPPHQPLDVHC